MAYRVVFTNGEQRELAVKAASLKYDKNSSTMEFRNDDGEKVAFVPIDRILYIKKTDE